MTEKSLDMIIKENGYEYVCEIGRGGFSYCYKVFSPQYQQFFVCKVIPITSKMGYSGKAVYNNELKALCKIIHPYIIQVYKTFSTKTHLFLILEFCPNGDFHEYIKAKGPMRNPVQLLTQVSKILDALTYLEDNNIAHKDIKPSNIFIDQHGRPKLGDFGLASFIEDDSLSEDYSGSFAFLAPEVIMMKPHDLYKADIWSFGVTLYYLATGQFPFPTRDRTMLCKAVVRGSYELPNDLNDVVKKLITGALVLDPNGRMPFIQMKNIVSAELERLTQIKSTSVGKIKSACNIKYIHPVSHSNKIACYSPIRISAQSSLFAMSKKHE